ncbi:multifunctional dye peroxidase DyP2 [Abditibacteriota bacterium]|nr:multifunctional dye peroxidase DyP2 [Abditibacteriota bacterium]
MPPLDLSDIQGFILRGYNFPLARHLMLQINDASEGKRFVGSLINGNARLPQITSSVEWGAVKPTTCLNIGFTYEGLKALGLPPDSLASFPQEFVTGIAGRATFVGDEGENAPENWPSDYATAQTHIVLSLYAQGSEVLETATAELRSAFGQQNALIELGHLDATDLPESRVHFGYVDGLSQPCIEGGPQLRRPDMQPICPAGEFLLGYPSQNPDFSYPVPTPSILGRNGSFSAFRVLEQDCDAFEQFLRTEAPKIGMNEEKLAAKICGRWRSGVPLVLSPDTDSPNPPLTTEQINNFDYVPSDSSGYACPIGAHMRRNNPRGERVAGAGAHIHRIIRRALPYGPLYDPATPNDGIKRGLVGHFICVSLQDQFEFLMTQWVNGGTFAPGLYGTKDPMLGDNDPEDSKFVLPTANGPQIITGFARFVTTRGGAYCFLPSLTALNYLASTEMIKA